jgi:uracil-DNA glycosylase family 4
MSRGTESLSLAAVRERIVSCNDCERLRSYCIRVGELKKAAHRDQAYWARPVPGFGDALARVFVVGLAPAAHGANRTGRVFTGDGDGGSGDFLMRGMHAAGFATLTTSRHPDDGLQLIDAYIGSAVRCAPPDNKPTPLEIATCRRHLESELASLPHVEVVVCLGRIAFDAVWQVLDARGDGIRPRPAFAHGAAHRTRSGWRVIAAYHPSRQNTNTGRLTAPMMEDIFQQARGLLGREGDSLTSASA